EKRRRVQPDLPATSSVRCAARGACFSTVSPSSNELTENPASRHHRPDPYPPHIRQASILQKAVGKSRDRRQCETKRQAFKLYSQLQLIHCLTKSHDRDWNSQRGKYG